MTSTDRASGSRARRIGRWAALFALVFVPVLVVAFILFPRPSCACEPSPSSPVDGIVVDVQATGLTEIHSFRLRSPAYPGDLAFVLGPLENPTAFPPGHLKAHQATGAPVRVYFTKDTNGQLTAYRLEDAPVPSASPASAGSTSP